MYGKRRRLAVAAAERTKERLVARYLEREPDLADRDPALVELQGVLDLFEGPLGVLQGWLDRNEGVYDRDLEWDLIALAHIGRQMCGQARDCWGTGPADEDDEPAGTVPDPALVR